MKITGVIPSLSDRMNLFKIARSNYEAAEKQAKEVRDYKERAIKHHIETLNKKIKEDSLAGKRGTHIHYRPFYDEVTGALMKHYSELGFKVGIKDSTEFWVWWAK